MMTHFFAIVVFTGKIGEIFMKREFYKLVVHDHAQHLELNG